MNKYFHYGLLLLIGAIFVWVPKVVHADTGSCALGYYGCTDSQSTGASVTCPPSGAPGDTVAECYATPQYGSSCYFNGPVPVNCTCGCVAPVSSPICVKTEGDSCTSAASPQNSCGSTSTNTGTVNCDGSCSASAPTSAPANPTTYGTACGATPCTNAGTYDCSGTCTGTSAITPGTGTCPATCTASDAGQACGATSCTSAGTYDCSGTCTGTSAITPGTGTCPATTTSYTGTWSAGSWVYGSCDTVANSQPMTRTPTCSTGSSSDCDPTTEPSTTSSRTCNTGTTTPSATPPSSGGGGSPVSSGSCTSTTLVSCSPSVACGNGPYDCVDNCGTVFYSLTDAALQGAGYESCNAPCTITSFTASPTSVSSGSFSTLSWVTSNCTSAAISPGVGTVSTVGTEDGQQVYPTSTTTYTLTATDGVNSPTATATVTVGSPPAAPASPAGANYQTSSGAVACNAAQVSWAPSAGAASYDLYRSLSNTLPGSPWQTTLLGNSYTYAEPTNTPYYYWVDASNAYGSSAAAQALPAPISSTACQANLSSSTKTFTQVQPGGSGSFEPIASGQAVGSGDVVLAQIQLVNSGSVGEASVVLADVPTNLVNPSSFTLNGSPWSVGTLPTSGPFTLPAIPRIAAGTTATVTFDETVAAPPGSQSGLYRFGNTADVSGSPTLGSGCTSSSPSGTCAVSSGSVPFRYGSSGTTIREVAP